MTAETRVVPDLDERTKEELQPPCDSRAFLAHRVVGTCDAAAEYVRIGQCSACGAVTKRLRCEPHAIPAGLCYCPACDTHHVTLLVLSLEPLR